jgi:aryl-alcohol dehydrogenase-like predicted oxidoreductase
VTSNIIGATTLAQLETDMASVDVRITPEIEARVNEIHQLHGNPTP